MSSIVSKDTLPIITPNKKNLNELIMRYKGHNENNESPLLKYTIYPESSMGGEYGLFHPNPKLYKVYYYIYFDGCKYEGDELFKEENAISL